ncbi:MAG: hypothetical protein FJ271_20285 [Planctomycetes bacterium]|nr:hypothetical protein [Planctomycetota bacterium]
MLKHLAESPGHACGKLGQQVWTALKQRHAKAGELAEPLVQRQRQLATTGPATHDDQSKRSGRAPQRLLEFVESLQKRLHRPQEQRRLAQFGGTSRQGTEAEAECVIGQGRPAGETYTPCHGVDPCHRFR